QKSRWVLVGLRWPTPLGQPQTSDFVRRAFHYPFLNISSSLRCSLLLRSLKKARLMPRRLKTYQTFLGFFGAALDRRSQAEDARWEKQKEKLEIALRRARD